MINKTDHVNSIFFFIMCKRYQHARDTNAHTRYQHFRDTDTQETRDTPSRLALLAQFFFLSFLNKHYFYNQVTSVLVLYNFSYIHFTFYCFPSTFYFLLVLVRNSWAARRKVVEYFWVFGITPHSEQVQQVALVVC